MAVKKTEVTNLTDTVTVSLTELFSLFGQWQQQGTAQVGQQTLDQMAKTLKSDLNTSVTEQIGKAMQQVGGSLLSDIKEQSTEFHSEDQGGDEARERAMFMDSDINSINKKRQLSRELDKDADAQERTGTKKDSLGAHEIERGAIDVGTHRSDASKAKTLNTVVEILGLNLAAKSFDASKDENAQLVEKLKGLLK